MNLVTFNNNSIKVIKHDNQKWLASVDVAKALGYEKTQSITNLYNNHKEEFDGMTEVIESVTPKNIIRRQRIFNREGCWLIGMFARTPKAMEFRRWVLEVLGDFAEAQLNLLPQPQIDMKAIGGMVKKCCAVAVRDEIANMKADDNMYNMVAVIMNDIINARVNNEINRRLDKIKSLLE